MLVSFCCPKSVPVIALSALSLGPQRFFVSCMWSLKVTPVSYVTPRIFVVGVCGICMLFSVTLGMKLCWCLSLVRSVVVDLAGAIFSLFSSTHALMKSKYSC